jgi:hypothetical protein
MTAVISDSNRYQPSRAGVILIGRERSYRCRTTA